MRVLKQDFFGRVEFRTSDVGEHVRRVASGCRWPGSRPLARCLLQRERRALAALRDVRGVPRLLDDPDAGQPGPRGINTILLRTWMPGEPLHTASALPADFFALLAELVAQIHAHGICHNDLHKENNILVGPDGRPALIDFQLASMHAGRGRVFAARCREDLRHVAKHRRRYELQGRLGPDDLPRKPPLARAWSTWIQPVWRRVRRLLHKRDDEPRRPRGGPWPRWTPPVGSAD